MFHRSLVFITLAALAGASLFRRPDPGLLTRGLRLAPRRTRHRDGRLQQGRMARHGQREHGPRHGHHPVEPGAAGSGLARAFDIAVGHGPFDIVSSDFNRDGVADLAVANADADTLSILLGDGSFGNGRRVQLPAAGFNVAPGVTDLNRDGHLDIAFLGFDGRNVKLLFGDGRGGFSSPTGVSGGWGGDIVLTDMEVADQPRRAARSARERLRPVPAGRPVVFHGRQRERHLRRSSPLAGRSHELLCARGSGS